MNFDQMFKLAKRYGGKVVVEGHIAYEGTNPLYLVPVSKRGNVYNFTVDGHKVKGILKDNEIEFDFKLPYSDGDYYTVYIMFDDDDNEITAKGNSRRL